MARGVPAAFESPITRILQAAGGASA